MLSIKDAAELIKTAYKESEILNKADLRVRFIFQVNLKLPGEENFPVLFSVDKITGTIKDVSIFDDPDRVEIAQQMIRKK
jgi:hypothetical protein